MDLLITIGMKQLLRCNLQEKLIFLGGNRRLKRQIFETIQRFSRGKSLNELEEKVFGSEGINIRLNGSLLKGTTAEFICLESKAELVKLCGLGKGSLLYEQVLNLKHDIKTATLLEELNDCLARLVIQMTASLDMSRVGIEIENESIELDELLRKYLLLTYYHEQTPWEVTYLNDKEISEIFINCLSRKCKNITQPLFLIIYAPEVFLDESAWCHLIACVNELSETCVHLKVFIFHEHDVFDFSQENFQDIIVVGKGIHLLPEFDRIKQSVIEHYPYEKQWSYNEFERLFLETCLLVGRQARKLSLSDESMILLDVLEGLLDEYQTEETSFPILSITSESTIL